MQQWQRREQNEEERCERVIIVRMTREQSSWWRALPTHLVQLNDSAAQGAVAHNMQHKHLQQTAKEESGRRVRI